MASQEVLTALETLRHELEKLEPAIKHVETAQLITQSIKGIPEKHIELLKEVRNNDALHKVQLKNLFKKELQDLTEENRRLQKNTDEIQRKIVAEQEALSKLNNTVKSFHDRVEKINFPERFDDLDSNVSGNTQALQSLQTTLSRIERNIIDRLIDLSDYQKETRSGLQTAIEQAKSSIQLFIEASAKRQKLLNYITWGLIVMSVVVPYLTKTP